MSLEKASAFDFEATATLASEEAPAVGLEEASTFDCPTCDATAPSTSVPYDALGYAVCPTCGHSPGPDLEG